MSYSRRDHDDRGRDSSGRLYVGNVNRHVRERDLRHVMDRYGRITDLVIMGTFAFVEFDDPRDASDAIRRLDGTRLEGDRIQVQFAKRQRSYDRDGGRDGGRDSGRDSGRDRMRDRGGDAPQSCCYNCGESGHFARECSLPMGSGKRAQRFSENRCFECGETGHRAQDCPARNGGGGGGGGNSNRGDMGGRGSKSRYRSRSRSRSRSASPRNERGRRPRSYSRSPSPRQSRSPVRRRNASPSRSRSPPRRRSEERRPVDDQDDRLSPRRSRSKSPMDNM